MCKFLVARLFFSKMAGVGNSFSRKKTASDVTAKAAPSANLSEACARDNSEGILQFKTNLQLLYPQKIHN